MRVLLHSQDLLHMVVQAQVAHAVDVLVAADRVDAQLAVLGSAEDGAE